MAKLYFVLLMCMLLALLIGCKTEKPQASTQEPVMEDMGALPDSAYTLPDVVQLREKAATAEELARATELLRTHSYRNNPEAQYHLGEACFTGQGVDQSNMEAYFWWTVSAHYGYAPAKQKIKNAHTIFSKTDLEEIQNRTNDWAEKYKDRHYEEQS